MKRMTVLLQRDWLKRSSSSTGARKKTATAAAVDEEK